MFSGRIFPEIEAVWPYFWNVFRNFFECDTIQEKVIYVGKIKFEFSTKLGNGGIHINMFQKNTRLIAR